MRPARALLRLLAVQALAGAEPVTGSAYLSADTYSTILRSMPIPTVDVLIFTHGLDRTLLFNRTARPVQHIMYSLGGRVLHNEPLRDAAMRKLRQELPRVSDMVRTEDLVPGGVVEEIFEDSAIPGVNSHCVNNVFGYVLPVDFKAESLLNAIGDRQHSMAAWMAVDDESLHPFMKRKVMRLLPVLHTRRAAGLLERLDGARQPFRPAKGVGGRRHRRVPGTTRAVDALR